MKVDGSYTIAAPRQKVWDALQDPEVLVGCIPGCESFEPSGDDAYEVKLRMGVGPVVGSYKASVEIGEKSPPDSYRLTVKGGGAMGTARGEALLRLVEKGDRTTVEIEAEARVTGVVARVGQRMMGSASKMLMKQFFDCITPKVESREGP